MTTNPTPLAPFPAIASQASRANEPAGRRVVIVNGNPTLLSLLEGALDAGHYDVVFVESIENAYSQIKRVEPDLVILCVHIDEIDGFQLLSMLKLDEATRMVPIITFTNELDGEQVEEDASEPAAGDVFATRPAQSMN